MNNPYRGNRFPAKIISYCMCLYHTFPLSFRDIEKMMLYRGITVTYAAIKGDGASNLLRAMPIRSVSSGQIHAISGI